MTIAAADGLRAAGHTVHTPDYYDGEVFDDLDDGLRKRDALGTAEIIRRGAREAVADLPAGIMHLLRTSSRTFSRRGETGTDRI